MADKRLPRVTSESQREARAKRDVDFFAERKVTEASNLEKTLRLRALRLAHEATAPKVLKPVRKAKKAAVKK
jgi:hypothetical protein